ncbi:MAG: Asp-tRNA(Asn)/Glu-tRNA(Gln) amidotransferase subunit GatC [Desulfarculaceae bacterium]|jgi:aspartyl-tRNA(Asn)/glutamyl-tRNA(Gln) amidotransferase subunit C
MTISRQEVTHVARLARLNLREDQIEKFTGQLNDILDAMQKLNELNTDGVPPSSHALDLTGALREDKATSSLERESSLSNAPESDGESFIVPRVI